MEESLIFPQFFIVGNDEEDPGTVYNLETVPDAIFDAWLQGIIDCEKIDAIYLLAAYRGLAAAQWIGRRYWVLNALAESGVCLAKYLFTSAPLEQPELAMAS